MALTKVIGDGIGNITGASLNDAKTIQFGSSQDSDIAHYSDGQLALRNTDSQGITFYSGSTPTEHMRIDATGAVTKPLQPAFQAKPGAAQNNMAVGSEVTIVLGTEIFDNNADFASNSFTAPVTGKYRFDVSLRLGAVDQASEYYLTRLNTSNRNHDMIFDSNENSNGDLDYVAFTFSVLTDMDANDTATLKFFQNSGTAQTDVDQTNTRLSGNLVC